MNELIKSTLNGQSVVSSRDIADNFIKEHKDVLVSIREILAAENSAASFFFESVYENRGKEYPEYLMNRDGFTLLAMGFTGSRSMQWKIKYIQAFNEMEKQLSPDPAITDADDLIIMLAKRNKELNSQLIAHDGRIEKLEEIQSHKAEVVQSLPPVNPLTQRAQLNQIVRGYAERNNVDYREAWGSLYGQFYSRYTINLKTRAKNRNQTPMDYAQYNGQLSHLLALSIEIFC